MPIDIEGWIETKECEAAKWFGQVSLSQFSIVANDCSDYLFGITKVRIFDSIFGCRGLPSDVSSEVKSDLDSYREFENIESNFSFDELFGFSFVLYSEILSQDISYLIDQKSQWLNVFECMRSMCAKGFDPDSIRVVVWAAW